MKFQEEDFSLDLLHSFVNNSAFKYRTYAFGGYLRDKLLNLPFGDLDLILAGAPDEGGIFATELTKKTGDYEEGVNPTCGNTAAQFFVRMPDSTKVYFDITPVAFLENETPLDVMRRAAIEGRDFAVNALYLDLTTMSYIDPTLESIPAFFRKDLCTLAPNYDVLFSSFPIRIHRMFRFHAKLGFNIPYQQLDYVRDHAWMANFVERDRIISEYNKMVAYPYGRESLKLMRATGVDPTDRNRSDIFLGEGWHECEPGQEPERVTLPPHYRWTSPSSILYLNPDVEQMELKFTVNPSLVSGGVRCFFDDSTESVRYELLSDQNNLSMPVHGIQKIRLETDTFSPSEEGNTDDTRQLGLYVSHITTFNKHTNTQREISSIPHLIEP